MELDGGNIEGGVEAPVTSEWAVEDDGLRFGEEKLPFDEAKRVFTDFRNDREWKAKNTQEAQRIAAEREQITKARQLEDFLNANPDKYAQVEAILRGQQANQGHQTEPWRGEIERLKYEMQVKEDMASVKSEMEALKSAHKEAFEKDKDLEMRVVKHALDNGIRSLRAAYRDMTYDDVQKARLEEGMKKKEEGGVRSKALAGVAGSARTGSKLDPSKYSTSEWYEMHKGKYNLDSDD